MARDNSGPAFPRAASTVKVFEGGDSHERTEPAEDGMSLRDYFAAKAMQGYICCEYDDYAEIAKWAYDQADAILKARDGKA